MAAPAPLHPPPQPVRARPGTSGDGWVAARCREDVTRDVRRCDVDARDIGAHAFGTRDTVRRDDSVVRVFGTRDTGPRDIGLRALGTQDIVSSERDTDADTLDTDIDAFSTRDIVRRDDADCRDINRRAADTLDIDIDAFSTRDIVRRDDTVGRDFGGSDTSYSKPYTGKDHVGDASDSASVKENVNRVGLGDVLEKELVVSAVGSDTKLGTESADIPTVGFAGVGTGEIGNESLELAELGTELTLLMTSKSMERARHSRNNIKLAWLEAGSPTSLNVPKIDLQYIGISDTKLLRGDNLVPLKPISHTLVSAEAEKQQTGKAQKHDLDLNVVASGSKDTDDLEGRLTKWQTDSKSKGTADKKTSLSSVTSPEKRESDLGKRLCQYDLESEKNYDDDEKKRITYKDKIKKISAKIINPCIHTIKAFSGDESSAGEGSPEDSSSSAKSSGVVTEETDLSDENQTSNTNSQSDKVVTALRISSGTESDDFDEPLEDPIDHVELQGFVTLMRKMTEINSQSDDNLVSDSSEIQKEPVESELDGKKSRLTDKDGKPVSDEFSDIQTSEDNLSPLEEDEDHSAESMSLKKTIHDTDEDKIGKVTPSTKKRITSSEEALSTQEKSTVKTEKDDIRNKADEKRKFGLTSSEESITVLSKSRSESETDTKESWVDFKSESTTASKKGLTSSEEGESDDSRKTDKLKSSDKKVSPEIVETKMDTSNKDRIQNLISYRKITLSSLANISRPQVIGQSDMYQRPVEMCESEESGISADNNSSLVELERISERLLPIGGTLTLVKGKLLSERSSPPSWGSASSLIGLTWESRYTTDIEPSEKSLALSLSTLHRETPIQELMQINKDTPQKSITRADIKSPLKQTISSESDTSSEETKHLRKIPCEQIISNLRSGNKDNLMKAQFCIDSITFGIRKSVSEERLFEAHRENDILETKDSFSVFPEKACDACTFLILIQTLIVREKVIHFRIRKVDACLVHNIGLDSKNERIYRYLLSQMPLCKFCKLPSVEKMILQLVQSRHGVLMHKSEHLAHIYVMFPPYAEDNRTIGRVVHLRKKKVSDYSEKPRIHVMMADRYILFPKHDSPFWGKTLKRQDTPAKKVSKTKGVAAKMDDIPELHEDIEEQKSKGKSNSLQAPATKKKPSKRKKKKCILKKWSVQTKSNVQASRRNNGSSSDELISPNLISGSDSIHLAHREVIALSNKHRKCVLKKWSVKVSPKTTKKLKQKYDKRNRPLRESLIFSESQTTTSTGTKNTSIAEELKATASTSQPFEHTEIDGVVLIQKKRPWWKCPKKKTAKIESRNKKPAVIPSPIMKPDYRKLLQPTEQVRTGGLARQDLLAQRLAYHYIKELTVSQVEATAKGEEIKVIKPSLTDFQSREYEIRRTFIRGQSLSRGSDESVSQDPEQEEYYGGNEKSDEDDPESPLNLAKYDLNQIDYHFESCPIIQEGKTPYKRFLKLKEVHKTSDFEDMWVEYHVEGCSYFMIDGCPVIDLKLVHLVLAEKKDDVCDCAEMLIKGGNIYHKDKSSQTFYHDLCLLFPQQLESGDIDVQSLFNPNILSRELDDNDIIRFYFISKRPDSKDTSIVDFREVPVSKFKEIEESIKSAFSNQEEENQKKQDDGCDQLASTSNQPLIETYQLEDNRDDLQGAIGPSYDGPNENLRNLSPLRVDSESEDSTTVYDDKETQIYYHLGQFTTQIQKGFTANQRVPSPKSIDPIEIKDDSAIWADQHSKLSSKTLLSPPISLQEMSLRQPDIEKQHKRRTVLTYRRSLSPRVGDQSGDVKRMTRQSSEYTSDQNVPPILRQGHSLDSIQNKAKLQSTSLKDTGMLDLNIPLDMRAQNILPIREMYSQLKQKIETKGNKEGTSAKCGQSSQRIGSQENVGNTCTCRRSAGMTLCSYMLAAQEMYKQTLCPHHGGIYDRMIAEQRRAFSQGDLSRITLALLEESVIPFDEMGGPKLSETSRRQSSYPPFQKTQAFNQRTRSQDLPGSGRGVTNLRHFDPGVTPAKTQESLKLNECSTSTFATNNRIPNKRTRSFGDLTTKQSLSQQQKSSDRGDVSPRPGEQLCVQGIYIPGKKTGLVRSPENISRSAANLQPQSSTDQRVSPRHTKGRFRQRLHSEELSISRSDRPGESSRRLKDDAECLHLWKDWKDSSPPF